MAQFFRKCKSVMAYWQHAHKTKTMPAEFSEQLKTSKEETNRIVKFAKSCGAGAAKKKSVLPMPQHVFHWPFLGCPEYF